jgi:hypothetical protein
MLPGASAAHDECRGRGDDLEEPEFDAKDLRDWRGSEHGRSG